MIKLRLIIILQIITCTFISAQHDKTRKNQSDSLKIHSGIDSISLDVSPDSIIEIEDDSSDVEEEVEEENPRFSFDLDYHTQYSYSGKKNDKNIGLLNPSISYDHPIGLSVLIDLLLPTRQTSKSYEFDLGIQYSYDFSDYLNTSIGYTRLFYGDKSIKFSKITSTKDSDNLLLFNPKNNLSVDITAEIQRMLAVGFSMEYLFGDSYDFNFGLSFSHSFNIGEIFTSHKIVFTPTINFSYGLIYGSTISKKQNKNNKNIDEYTISKTAKFLTINDYQVVLPISYTAGPYVFSFRYSADFPMNEMKKQSGNNYSDFILGLSYLF